MNYQTLDSIDPDTLTESERCIYRYLLEHPQAPVTMSLQAFCQEVYTSTASVVRFCQKLGYAGYNELKYTIRQRYENNQQEIKEMKDFLDWQLSVAMDSISHLDFDLLSTICDALCSAEVCYIYGSDSSLMAAQYIHSIMTSLDYRTTLLQGRYLLEAFTYNFNKNENAAILLLTAHASQEYYGKIIENLKECGQRVIWICSEENNTIPLSHQIFIHTDEKNVMYRNIDMNFKLHTLTLLQALIEMLCHRRSEQL